MIRSSTQTSGQMSPFFLTCYRQFWPLPHCFGDTFLLENSLKVVMDAKDANSDASLLESLSKSCRKTTSCAVTMYGSDVNQPGVFSKLNISGCLATEAVQDQVNDDEFLFFGGVVGPHACWDLFFLRVEVPGARRFMLQAGSELREVLEDVSVINSRIRLRIF